MEWVQLYTMWKHCSINNSSDQLIVIQYFVTIESSSLKLMLLYPAEMATHRRGSSLESLVT